MSTTLTELHARLSRRLGEDSVPTITGNEGMRRTQFINEGLKAITRKHYWWWTEKSTTFSSVANQASYSTSDGFPSDIRNSHILELRFDGTLYTPAIQSDVFDLTNASYSGKGQEYMVFAKSLYPLPAYPSTGTDNVSVKYYKVPSLLSSGSDAIDIPDEYADILVAFALGRIQSLDGKRGSAADNYDEFKEIYQDMEKEQNNYLFALKSSSETGPLYE